MLIQIRKTQLVGKLWRKGRDGGTQIQGIVFECVDCTSIQFQQFCGALNGIRSTSARSMVEARDPLTFSSVDSSFAEMRSVWLVKVFDGVVSMLLKILYTNQRKIHIAKQDIHQVWITMPLVFVTMTPWMDRTVG